MAASGRKIVLVSLVVFCVGAVAALWFCAHSIEGLSPEMPQLSLKSLDSHRGAMEDFVRQIEAGKTEKRQDGIVGYVVPERICVPQPGVVVADEQGNVFFEIWSTWKTSCGYVYVRDESLPKHTPVEPEVGKLEHLSGPWYAYWSHH